MTALTKLSAPKFRAEFAARKARFIAACDATLRAGLGDASAEALKAAADSSDQLVTRNRVAREYLDARQAWVDVQDAADARGIR